MIRNRAEDCISLRIGDLCRHGLLTAEEIAGDLVRQRKVVGYYRSRGDVIQRSIYDRIVLTYRLDYWEQEATQVVKLTWVKNPHIGKRAMFICPCGNRAQNLHLAWGMEWRCRACFGLIDASEHESVRQRAVRKLARIEARIETLAKLNPLGGRQKAAHARLCQIATDLRRKIARIKPRRTREEIRLERLRRLASYGADRTSA